MSQFYWPAILLFATFILLGLELVVPSGGVIGVFAVLTYIASTVAAFAKLGLSLGTLYLSSTMIIALVVGRLFVRIWPNTPIGRRLFGTPPTLDEVIPERHRDLAALIGARGKAVSTMIPSGAIRVNGRIMDAVSDGMVIEAGTPIEIIRVKANHLVVRPADATGGPQTEAEIESAINRPIDPQIQDPFQD